MQASTSIASSSASASMSVPQAREELSSLIFKGDFKLENNAPIKVYRDNESYETYALDSIGNWYIKGESFTYEQIFDGDQIDELNARLPREDEVEAEVEKQPALSPLRFLAETPNGLEYQGRKNDYVFKEGNWYIRDLSNLILINDQRIIVNLNHRIPKTDQASGSSSQPAPFPMLEIEKKTDEYVILINKEEGEVVTRYKVTKDGEIFQLIQGAPVVPGQEPAMHEAKLGDEEIQRLQLRNRIPEGVKFDAKDATNLDPQPDKIPNQITFTVNLNGTPETGGEYVLMAGSWYKFAFDAKEKEYSEANQVKDADLIKELQSRYDAAEKQKTEDAKKVEDVKTPVASVSNGPKFKDVFSVAAAVSGVALGLLAAIVILRDTICRESQSKFKKFTVSCAAAVAAFALSIAAVVQAAFKTLALIAISAITAGDKPKWLIRFKAKHLVLAPISLCVAAKLAFNTLIHTWKFNTPIFENKIIGEKAVEEFTAKKEADLSLRNPKTLYANARKLLNESWIGSLKRAEVKTA